MKKNIIMLVVAIILVIIAVFFYFWAINYEVKQDDAENKIETEISKTKDLDNVEYSDFVFYKEDREEVKLSDYKDKPAMILFWSQDNEDSVSVLKKVNEMYEKYKDKINFFMISTEEEVNDELKSEISLEIYYDYYKEGILKYNVSEVPAMIYISEDNEIFNAKVGFTTTDALEANLDLISNNY
jgi:nitrogen fixation-related uncharacterized protein